MPKRKYEREEETNDGYVDTECPQCGAVINVRFQRGRHSRRLRCPVCKNLVMLSRRLKDEMADLIQLQAKSNKQ